MEEKRNFTLLTDFYELTMMQGYFREKADDIVVFDAFYRKNPSGSGYAIACGLEQVIDYIKNLSFSYEDVDYLRSLNMFDEEFLNNQPAVEETKFLRHVHFESPIVVKMDGKNSLGVVLKPAGK